MEEFLMYEKTCMKFDLKNNKEYIYSKESFCDGEGFINELGKTFIDFLANSEDILRVIEKEIFSYHKDDKLGDTIQLHIITKFKLEKLNVFFKYFDFDSYIENYVKNLRDKNNIEIQNSLEEIRNLEKRIEYYRTIEYYNENISEEISYYHDYNSKESKKGFYYIDRAEKEVNEKIKKYINKYNFKLSYNMRKRLYKENKNALKGEQIIDQIDQKIYNEHKLDIERKVTSTIEKNIKCEKKYIKFYKSNIKYYLKNNERTLQEIFNELIASIKFWINFSKYILISFYNLSSEQYNSDFSATQRLLDYLLRIERTYFNQDISKLPKSNITLELDNGKDTIDLNNFVERNKNELLSNSDNIFGKLNTYNVNIIQEYSITNIEDFISVSLIQILQSNVKICRCKNCDKLFIAVNKSNEKYCNYKFKGEKTCRDLSYSLYLQKNELSNILRKKYRTENARKNRNQHIPNIEDKFQIWYTKAKAQKKLCEQEKITIDEFYKWFEDNKKWF